MNTLGTHPSFSRRLRRAALGLAVTAIATLPVYAAAADLTVLHSFGYQPDGEYPEGRLAQDSNGTLYGTTYEGGVNGYGMAFSIAADGTFTTLHSFAGSDGQQLTEGMTLGSDGKLYGTTPQGTICVTSSCTGFGGSIFKLTTAGVLTTLHYFAGNGLPDGYLPGDLTDGGDGFFYGTNTYGGAAGVSGLGTVFRVSPKGAFKTLHSFTLSEPYYPVPGLTRGLDGNFYGASQSGPSATQGMIFAVTPSGVVTTVHRFSGTDGANPRGKLLLASDGSFYGTTGSGGTAGGGTIFHLMQDGTLTTLYAFNGSDGNGPAAGLVQTNDGTLYGVTGGGGNSGGGTLFKLSPAGTLTTLHLFTFGDGTNPSAGPILGADGLLYGTTTQGGGGPGILPTGTVYKFDPAASHPPVLSLTKVCFNEFDECFPPIDTAVGGFMGLVWYSANVSDCFATGAWFGKKPTGGNVKFQTVFAGRYNYKLTCKSANGPVSSSVTIRVIR